MPKACGGVQGQAVFIDTEGSFNVSRLKGNLAYHIDREPFNGFFSVFVCLDMSEACIQHCNSAIGLPDNAWTYKSIIDNIFVFRCKEITEFLSCVMILKEFLKTHEQVIDNDTYMFFI